MGITLIPRHISKKRDTKLASLNALLVPSLPVSSHSVYRQAQSLRNWFTHFFPKKPHSGGSG